MTGGWVLLALGTPLVLTFAAIALRPTSPSPLAAIAVNALAPGAGLALLGRPMLEVAVGLLVTVASLLTIGGFDELGMYVPIMIVGGVWASIYTPLNPFKRTLEQLPPPTVPRRDHADGGSWIGSTAAGATAAQARSKGDEAAAEGYRVAVRCTECGADIEVPVLHRMAHCEYCDSHHLVIGHEDTLYVTIPEKAHDQQSLREALLDHYRYQHYLKLYARRVTPLENRKSIAAEDGTLVVSPELSAAAAAAEQLVSRAADGFRARLATTLEVTPRHHFLAPYRHGMGTLYEAAFGRSRSDMEKKLGFAVGTVEAATLASEGVDLPAMGKLSYLRAVLPAALLGENARCLPLDLGPEALQRAYGHLDRKQLDRSLQVIRLGTVFVPEVNAVVWRPWWVVDVSGGGVSETVLVDAAAGSVAGAPPSFDTGLLEELPIEAREPGTGLRFLPMECPTCGYEFPFDVAALAHFCRNCHRVFTIHGTNKKEREYDCCDFDERAAVDLVPFWRFPLRLRTADGKLLTDLPHLTDGIDGTFDQIGDGTAQRDDELFVPAIRLINARLMSEAFNRLFHFTVRSSPTYRSGRFPLDEKPQPLTVSLGEAEARELAPLYLANAFGRRDLARVNVNQVASWLFGARLQSTGRLTFLAVPRAITEPFRAYIGRGPATAVTRAEGTSRST
ncbi:MAG: hypothetical protein LJE95_07735 [Acidobacteria bacterium]|nr:hypothetical protein [Acidobacteriota bacterium]